MELAIVVWIFCGIGAALVAQSRGANGCLWFGLGVLFGPFGLAFAFASGTDRKCPRCRERVHPKATRCPKCQADLVSSPATKKCPDCAEDVRSEARKCRFCGSIFPEPPRADPEPEQPEAGSVSAPTAPPKQLQFLALEGVSARQLDEEAWRFWKDHKALAFSVLILLVVLAIGYQVLPQKEGPHKTAGNATPGPATQQGTADEERQKEKSITRRTENTISMDTSGCSTFDQIVALAGSSTNSMPGCIDLDEGQRVIGPLEVKGSRFGNSNTDFARIEVPGKGERWTFLAHLAK
jgi:hypothetical protein